MGSPSGTYMLQTAMGLARTEVLQSLSTTTKVMCSVVLCACVFLCSVIYAHTYRPVKNGLSTLNLLEHDKDGARQLTLMTLE